jgi:hypothetical protein
VPRDAAAGAVMGGRNLHFKGCEFRNNAAKFAGALRINDIGDALIEDCLFIGNSASGTVRVQACGFYFAGSPLSF